MLLVALLAREPLLLRRGLLPRDFLLQRPLLLLLLPLQQQRRRRANASNESVRAVGGSPSSPRSFAAPSSVLPSRPAPSLPPRPRPAAYPAEAGVRRCRAPHRPRASARPRCRRARLAGPGASAGPRAGRRVCAQGRAALGSTAPGTVGLNAHSRLINNQKRHGCARLLQARPFSYTIHALERGQSGFLIQRPSGSFLSVCVQPITVSNFPSERSPPCRNCCTQPAVRYTKQLSERNHRSCAKLLRDPR